MLPVIWRASAREDLSRIIEYIAERNPQAARRMKDRIEGSVIALAEHPYLHRVGRVPGTREVIAHPNYIVVYRVAADRIEVSGVLHARQEYP